jgi:hypothetical protein
MMRLSADYSEIKARALALLREGSVNNHPWTEVLASAREGWIANSVGVALCRARDELATPLFTREGWGKGTSFNKGNFNKARREIIRELKLEAKRLGIKGCDLVSKPERSECDDPRT